MTTQQVIRNLAAWLEEQTADLEYKRASEFSEVQAEGYKYELTRPAIYEVQLPINAAEHIEGAEPAPITAPAVIVTSGGETTIETATGKITSTILLKIHTWDPGQHSTDENGEGAFTVDGEGWRDCLSLMDAISKRLAEAEFPAGCCLTGDIICSYPDGDENPYYPYYIGSIQFDIQHFRTLKNNKFNI